MMAYLRRATLSFLLTSLCFTALVLERESCVLWLKELSQVPISLLLPSRRPLLIPAQVLVREVSACPSLTLLSPSLLLQLFFPPLKKEYGKHNSN